jgi:hypothetical protein
MCIYMAKKEQKTSKISIIYIYTVYIYYIGIYIYIIYIYIYNIYIYVCVYGNMSGLLFIYLFELVVRISSDIELQLRTSQ